MGVVCTGTARYARPGSSRIGAVIGDSPQSLIGKMNGMRAAWFRMSSESAAAPSACTSWWTAIASVRSVMPNDLSASSRVAPWGRPNT